MSFLSKYSLAAYLLRRRYSALAVALTAAVWVGMALLMLPVEDRAGTYVTRPYGFMTGLEEEALDLLFQLRDVKHPERRARGLGEPVTLIEIDDASIHASNVRLQKWPRSFYARLIDRASEAGANTIGLDVYLSEAGGVSDFDKAADEELARSIEDAGNVVIVEKLPRGGSEALVPLPLFRDVAWGVGFADLPHESDRYVRTAQLTHLRRGDDGNLEVKYSFASMLAQGFTEQPLTKTSEQTLQLDKRSIPLRNDGNLQIDFRTRTPGFRRVSAKDILCAELKRTSAPDLQCDEGAMPADELFRDRVVLIGATNNDAPDLFTTPFYQPRLLARPLLRLYDRELPTVARLMPGIEVHANTLATLLEGDYLVRPRYRWQAAFLLAPLALVALAIFGLRALWAFLLTLAVMVGLLAVSSWAFNRHALILPLAGAATGVLLLAPLGSLLRYARERSVREEKEAERAAIMDIFSRCVSPEVAGTLWERRGGLKLGGELRTVTIIFTDIRGFTSLAEDDASAHVVEWLNEYFNRMHRIVCDFGGHINKFIGDGLLIVFGAPVARGDRLEARAAVACGLEMLAEVERINRDWEGTGRPKLAIGVGVHTGEATCGVVGAEGRLEYTVIGDTVNLASRLESVTKEKEVAILVSDATARLLGVDYETRPLGDVRVKGKTQSTTVYTVRKAEHKKAAPAAAQVG